MKSYLKASDIRKLFGCNPSTAYEYIDYVMNTINKSGERYVDSDEYKHRCLPYKRELKEVPTKLFVEFYPSTKEQVKGL